VFPLLPEHVTIVFDNGVYTKSNDKLIEAHSLGFVTRLRLNKSDNTFVQKHKCFIK
jgi:transposase